MHVIRRKRPKISNPPQSVDYTQPPTVNEEVHPESNAEDLVQNAVILFRRSNGDIEQGVSSHHSDPSGKNRKMNPNQQIRQMAMQAKLGVKNELGNFDSFVKPFKASIGTVVKNVLVCLILPLSIVAAILFY